MMKNLSANKLLILFVMALQFSCAKEPQSYSSDVQNSDINITRNEPQKSKKYPQNAHNSVSEINRNNYAKENFEKEWEAEYPKTSSELDKHLKLWCEKQITDYDFVIYKIAGGLTNPWNRLPVVIKVRGGEFLSIEKQEDSKTYHSRTDGFDEINTVEKQFAYIRGELENGNLLNVKYDKEFGFPKEIGITFTFQSNHNTRWIRISDFKALN